MKLKHSTGKQSGLDGADAEPKARLESEADAFEQGPSTLHESYLDEVLASIAQGHEKAESQAEADLMAADRTSVIKGFIG